MSSGLPPASRKRQVGFGLLAGLAALGVAASIGPWFRTGPRRHFVMPPSDNDLRESASSMQATDIHSSHEGSPREGGTLQGDRAPGEDREKHEDIGKSVRGYLIGLGLAGLLTAGSFALSGTDLVWGPAVPAALIVFAIAQMGVHLVFFLHLTTAPDNINNAMALAFGILIVLLLIGGSVWIMYHLNQTMMPAGHMGTMSMP